MLQKFQLIYIVWLLESGNTVINCRKFGIFMKIEARHLFLHHTYTSKIDSNDKRKALNYCIIAIII